MLHTGPKPQKIPALETMARELVGDDKSPDLFFVTDQGVVVTVTRDFQVAYTHWKGLANRSPRLECALENRTFGVVCDVSPESDEPEAELVIRDDRLYFRGGAF